MMKKFVKVLLVMMLLLMVACGKTTKIDEHNKDMEKMVEVVLKEKLVVNKDLEFKRFVYLPNYSII